jgi:hypothetical protein
MHCMAKTALAAGFLLASTHLASAGVVSESQSFGPATTNWSTTLNFAGFNTGLGTLTEVDITVTETLTGTAQATNTSTSSPGSGSISLINTASVAVPSLPISFSNTATTPTFTLNPSETSATYGLGGSSTDSGSITTGLATFEAPWSASASDSGATSSNFSGGNETTEVSDTGLITVSVDYIYRTIPTDVAEPLSVAVLGAGLLALGFVRRRSL